MLQDVGFGNDILGYDPQGKGREKGFYRTKKLLKTTETINRVKRQPIEREKLTCILFT